MQNMQVLVLVLNHYEKLSKLLLELNEAGIKGATVINSSGMAGVLTNSRESDAFLGSIRQFLTPEREDNRTIFLVLSEDKVEIAKKVIQNVIGKLDKPGVGILFILPTIYTEGIL